MGPKYEFTGKTMKHDCRILHQIRRISDGKIGGWIEKEDNLSQEGSCWVDDNAKVDCNAKVYGNAKVYDNAWVSDKAQVFDDARVYGNAKVGYGAWVYDKVKVYGHAKIYGKARVYNNAEVYGNTEVYSYVEIYGNVKITGGKYTNGKFSCNKDLLNYSESKRVTRDFINKIEYSNKLTIQTEYDSIDEFFAEHAKNDIKLDTLTICVVDTKEPLIKLQKVEVEDKTEFKFIVDITNEDSDNFTFKSVVIKSREYIYQLIQQIIEALENYPKFNKYIYALKKYL